MDQRAAQPELLLHAAGQFARRALAEGRQAGAVQQFVDAPGALSRALAKQTGKEIQVLDDRQGWVKVLAQALGHVGDVRAGAAAVSAAGHVAAEHLDLSALDLTCTRQQCQQAGFADAIRTDQADHALRRYLQGQRVQCTGFAVA